MRRFRLVVALAVVAAGLALAAPAGAVSVSWSGPLAIDRALPFADRLGPVICARSGLCVAMDSLAVPGADDAIVVSRHPGGGRTSWQQTIFPGLGLASRVGSR